MSAVAFDTLKFARTLREKAHLTPEQAEGIADPMAEVFAGSIPTKGDIGELRTDIEALRLATKADIESSRLSTKADIDALRLSTTADLDTLRMSTKADLDSLRLSTRADIDAAKSGIIKWMFGTIGFQTIVVLGAVVALARSLH